MKPSSASLFYPVAAAMLLSLTGVGCTHDYSYNPPNRKRIPLAPVGAVSPGIGGPGGTSADTRATGTVASGEGDTPVGVTDPALPPVVTPGVAPGTGTTGVHGGNH